MGRLTTHVLDTAGGGPAGGVDVRVYAVDGERRLVASSRTNADGRTDDALLEGSAFEPGTYELEFDVGAHFANANAAAVPPFLGTVVIRVTLGHDEHYHVPLLVSPWSYSTYRGS